MANEINLLAPGRRDWVLGAAAMVAAPAAVSADDGGTSRQAANLRIVRRYARAWQSGDVKATVACYHPEFTLHYFGNNALTGSHAGLPAALPKLAEFTRRTQRKLVAIVDAFAGEERVCLIARERFTKGSEQQDVERVFVYTTKDDRLHHCWVYDADPALVDRYLA